MDTPVTRRELREELANYPTKADLREALANYATKADLREVLAVALATKADLSLLSDAVYDRTEKLNARIDGVSADLQTLRLELSADIAQHARGNLEAINDVIVQAVMASEERMRTFIEALSSERRQDR